MWSRRPTTWTALALHTRARAVCRCGCGGAFSRQSRAGSGPEVVHDGLDPAVHVRGVAEPELPVDVRHVSDDRALLEVQLPRDGRVAEAPGHQAEHVFL